MVTIQESPNRGIIAQNPASLEFLPEADWPKEMKRLYMEASTAFSAGAYTAAAMVCRKLLMVIACKEGDVEGKSFLQYVDYIVEKVVPIPAARKAIDEIRKVGNDANHDVTFVDEAQSRQSMKILHYLLRAVYSLRS